MTNDRISSSLFLITTVQAGRMSFTADQVSVSACYGCYSSSGSNAIPALLRFRQQHLNQQKITETGPSAYYAGRPPYNDPCSDQLYRLRKYKFYTDPQRENFVGAKEQTRTIGEPTLQIMVHFRQQAGVWLNERYQ
jgi:hypothetical protein